MGEPYSKWTLESLYEFFQQRLEDLESKMQAAHNSSDRAVNKAEEAANKRLDSMNEFRAALGDQADKMLSRAESDVLFKMIDSRLSRVERYRSEQTGVIKQTEKVDQKIAWIIGILVSVGLAIAAAIFKT